MSAMTSTPDVFVPYNTTTPVSTDDNTSEYNNLRSATMFLSKYYIWIIFAFGFPGNLFSFFVIWRMSRRRLTTSFFFIALLAVVDNIAIILKIIENQIRINRVAMSAEACKVLFFVGLTLAAYPHWILIAISAERFTEVRCPLNVRKIWSLKKSALLISCVLVFLCLVNLHILFTISSRNQRCIVHPQHVYFYYPLWFFISSSVYAFIPAISLVIFNILIIILIRRSSHRMNALSESEGSSVERQERQVTFMLVTLAIVFVILTIPRCIFVLLWSSWVPEDAIGMMRKYFMDIFTASLADSNHAVNFYLYFVAGKTFRKYILDLFRPDSVEDHEASCGKTQASELKVAESRL